MNEALLYKWLWRFGEELEALWRVVILEKYGVGDSMWESKKPRRTYGVSVWRSIFNVIPKFKEGIKFEIHNGTLVRFWEDVWLGDRSFEDTYPHLYGLSRRKFCSIAEIQVSIHQGSWDLGVPRRIGQAANRELQSLRLSILNVTLDNLQRDKRIWAWEKSNLFSVKSMFVGIIGRGIQDFPSKLIWNNIIPTRISFFAWTAIHGKILTVVNLRTRGKLVNDLCYLCGEEEEDVNHLLLHCEFAQHIWSWFWRNFEITMINPLSVKNLFESWNSSQFRGRARILWRLLPTAVIWAIWNERNARAFRNKFQSKDQTAFDVIRLLHVWSGVTGAFQGVRLEDFIARWDQIVFDPG